jgi:hypothetical protein
VNGDVWIGEWGVGSGCCKNIINLFHDEHWRSFWVEMIYDITGTPVVCYCICRTPRTMPDTMTRKQCCVHCLCFEPKHVTEPVASGCTLGWFRCQWFLPVICCMKPKKLPYSHCELFYVELLLYLLYLRYLCFTCYTCFS